MVAESLILICGKFDLSLESTVGLAPTVAVPPHPIAPNLNPIEMAFAKRKGPLSANASGPSTPCRAPSEKSATSSAHKNVETTSSPQDTDSHESLTL